MRPNKKEAKNNFAYFFPISLDIQFDNSNFTNLQESQYLNKSKVVGFFTEASTYACIHLVCITLK